MADRPPDLRVMLVELGRAIQRVRIEVVTDDEIRRVENADNVLLVLTRVLTAMAKRAGVSNEQVLAIVAKAKQPPPVDPADLFEAKVVVDSHVTGRRSDWDICHAVDKAMADLEARSRMPPWFVDGFWPPVLQRCAQGIPMTDRERAVASYVASVAKGEW